MNLFEVNGLAKQLLKDHALEGWSFAFNKNKRRLGVCKQDSKIIELSAIFAERNSFAQVLDTLLHEIAHALVGVEHGHDRVWKDMCLHLGCNPESCSDEADMPVGYWQARCPSCRTLFSRHRRPKSLRGRYCSKCGPERGRLIFSDARQLKRKEATGTALVAPASQPAPQQLKLRLF